LMPDGQTLLVANGGIETHPASGRMKLNLPVMRPNLAYLDATGQLLDLVEPAKAHHMNSIRHLAVRDDGLVALATQWQGNPEEAPPLLATHRMGEAPVWLAMGTLFHHTLNGYGGSVAFSGDGQEVAISSPRGNAIHCFKLDDPSVAQQFTMADVCGLATRTQGFLATSGQGDLARFDLDNGLIQIARHGANWDNHLISLAQPG